MKLYKRPTHEEERRFLHVWAKRFTVHRKSLKITFPLQLIWWAPEVNKYISCMKDFSRVFLSNVTYRSESGIRKYRLFIFAFISINLIGGPLGVILYLRKRYSRIIYPNFCRKIVLKWWRGRRNTTNIHYYFHRNIGDTETFNI